MSAEITPENTGTTRLEEAFASVVRCFQTLPDEFTEDGENPFRYLARELCSALPARSAALAVALNAECDGVRTLAVWGGESFVSNFDYALSGSPFGDLSSCSLACIGDSARERFPDDELLRRFDADWLIGAPLRDRTGSPIGLLCALGDGPGPKDEIARDLVELFAKRAQLELERRAVELDLFEARKTAEVAERTKTEFIANVSHEVRTPMNGVFGMMTLLQETDLSDEQLEYVHTAVSACEDLMDIISDILDFSKIQSGQLKLKSSEFDVKTIVDEVIGQYAERADRKGISLRAVGPEHEIRVVGDRRRFRHVIKNFVSNGVKFTQYGGVVVKWNTEAAGSGRIDVRVEVIDTGIGMPSDVLDKLFQPFWQYDSSFTRRFGGTGLGLPVAQQLAELMGGRVEVDTKENEGSSFRFIAPTGLPDRARVAMERALEANGAQPTT